MQAPVRRGGAVIAAMALLLAACSSTTSNARHRTGKTGVTTNGGESSSADATTATTDAAASAVPDAGGVSSEAGGVSAGRRGPTATTTPAAGQALVNPATGLVPSNHPGVTRTEVRVGVTYAGDAAQVSDTFGLKGVNGLSASQAQTLFTDLASYVNAHGGVAGRKLVVIVKPVNVLTGTFDAQAQSVCESFTNDTPVAAVITFQNVGSDVLPSCLAAHDSVQIEHGNSAFHERQKITGTFRSSFYDPHRIELDRFGMVIDQLADQGFFDKGAKVGLIRFDSPENERTEKNVVRPALAAHGVTLTDTYAFKQPGSTAAISSTANEANSAVLRFRGKGIDHVIFQLTLTALPFLFIPAAESQGYRPRYGFSSGDIPDFLTQNVPAAQLDRSAVVGWSRIADQGERQSFADTPAMRTCMKIIAHAGLTYPGQGYGVVCDPFFFLQAALNKAPRVSAAGFRSAVDALGSSFALLDTPATRFGPNRFTGPNAVRAMKFDRGCTCYKYTSGPHPVP